MSMKPVCIKCRIEMRPKQNGIVSVSMATFGPMEIRRADVWYCPCCDFEFIYSYAASPEAAHFDPAFELRLRSYELDPTQRIVKYWLNQRERDGAKEKTC